MNKLATFTFNLFPNPGSEALNFTTDLTIPIHVIMRDNQGKTVYENIFDTPKFTIKEKLIELNKGIYFVDLQNEKSRQRLTRKWMKLE